MLEGKKSAYYTVREAADKLGVTIGRVHQLICRHRIATEKLGFIHVIAETELAKLIEERKKDKRCKWPTAIE